ncbi:MAG: S41 family peptidase, partial [Paracoccaceae bacterium]|nr:S41 family peptidase [Paracoccaceae bacterium]
PAFEAGIQAGDYIIEIEGETVLEMDLQEAVDRMRGPPGEDITITILRENVDNPFEVTITRDIIQIEAAEVRRIGDVIIARVKTFSNQAIPNLEEGIEEVVDEYGDIHDFAGLVIDLRNNPGGLLQSAVGVTDLFLDEGDIVSIRRRDEQADTFKAGDYHDGDISHGLPIVVLINSGSASASEIVAGALQDNERAAVIGTQSFGKGSVQTLIDLDSEKGVDSSSERKFGGLRMTTAKYYTPSGKSIQGNGITPDILLEWQYVEVEEEEEDSRYLFSEAKYGNSLENDGIPINEEEQEEMAKLNEALEELRRTDNQLGYAIDLIHGFKALGSGKF